ncbi:MAG: hypothetical protein ACRENU_10590 [Gemmatimonadaceae bacterium]
MADLVIESSRPSERAAEIKDLFDRAGKPEFSGIYDRVYRAREASGLKCWLGRSEGRAVLHISVALEPFSDGVKTLSAGLLGDLMADETQRDFWGPLKLVRQMVSDVRKQGKPDFLLTSFTANAEGVFKGSGFKLSMSLRHHVMPLIWPYPLLRRLLVRERVPSLTAIPFAAADHTTLLPELTCPGTFRPVPTPAYFTTRMPRESYPEGHWLVAGSPSSAEAAVLVSPINGELRIADVLWRDAAMPLAGLLAAVAKWGSRAGHRRLALTAGEGSLMSAAAQRAGFLLRPSSFAVKMLPLVPAESLPPFEKWWFTPFALTAW